MVGEDGNWDREVRRRENLIREFKNRERSAFYAMIGVGFLFSTTEFFVYYFFIFFAIFGAFQINFMALIKDLSNVSPRLEDNVENRANHNQTGLRGGFLANLTNGVLGNFVWWIIFMIGLFTWQQVSSAQNPLKPPVNLEKITSPSEPQAAEKALEVPQ